MFVIRLLARTCLALGIVLVAATVLPGLAGWRSYVVMSGSMEPAIHPGDVIVGAPADSTTIVPGRVVVFQVDGRRLAHRVESRTAAGFVTRGDANATADSAPVPPAAVMGVARLRVPAVGLPVYWAATRQWHPLSTAAAALLFVLLAARKAGHGRRNLTATGRHRAGAGGRQAARRWPRPGWQQVLAAADPDNRND
ncbi:signal peptidase I [Dactylosporangium sp. CA-152071]|uniref:signal peptidase I n=1 Tax=Dactylosporangium sp. CA-152071 TaxID=3239933 RepID=UPI003D8F7ABC